MRNESAFLDSDIIDLSQAAPDVAPEPRAELNYGMTAGTMVETEFGWRPVETLAAGIKLFTYDGGLRPLARVERSFARAAAGAGLVRISGGVIEGVADAKLLPNQLVLIDSAAAEAALGRPSVLIPAAAFDGVPGVGRRASDAVLDLTTLAFEDEEVIFADGALRVHCPALDGGVTALTHAPGSGFWDVLDVAAGREILAGLMGSGLPAAA
ncbi:MAG: Hint domain-containing protein [Paracoccaceae bacterium]